MTGPPLELPLAVVPVLTGPLQALLALLPWIGLTLLGLAVSLLRPRALWSGLKLLWRTKGTVLALGAIVGGSWTLWRAWGPAATRGEVSRAEKGGDWPLFRGGLSRTGAVDGAAEPVRGKLAWIWKDGRTAVFSSPAVVGNRVYVTTALTGFGGGEGRILCLDADTGEVVWETAPPGYRATFSSPVVSGERLVCGEGLHYIRDARVVCVDLSPGREGQVLWTFRTASHVECTPVIADGRVYVGAGDDGYYCLELEPSADGSARVVWHADGKDYPDAETAIVVHDGRVYAGLGWGGKALCVLDARTGERIRRVPTDYPVFSPPAIADGRLYVGMGNGDYVKTAEDLGLPPAGALWCLDLASLEVRWKHPVGRTVLGAPAVRDGRVYFGCRDGKLYCLGADGTELGAWNTYAPVVTSPAVTERQVCVLSDSGVLYALDRDSLEPRWEMQVSSGPMLFSSPAVARGRVLVGTEHDGLVAVGEPGEWDTEPRITVWPGPLGGPGVCGNRDDSPLVELGAMHWQYPEDQMGESEAALVTAPPAVVDDDLFIPLAGDSEERGIACLPVGSATLEPPKPRWLYRTDHPVLIPPVVSGATVLAVDGQPGDEGRRLHAVDRAMGDLRWSAPVSPDATGTLACSEDEVFVQDAGQALSCLHRGGERRWSQPLGRMEHPPTPLGDLLVVALVEPPSLAVLDRPTGRRLWQRQIDASPTTAPVMAEPAVLVGTVAGLEARSLLDGSAIAGWSGQAEGVSGPLLLWRERIAYVSSSGELSLVSREDGRPLGRSAGALPGFAPLPCRDRILFLGHESIQAIRIDPGGFQGEPEPWADTSWLGRPTASMVLSGGSVYVGMVGWGIVRWGAP